MQFGLRPPTRELLVLKVRLLVDLVKISIDGILQRWSRAAPHYGWDGYKIPQIKGWWSNIRAGVETREGADRKRREWGCKPVLSCPSSPPSHIRVYSEKSAVCGSSWSSELALLVGFVCTKGKRLDWDYHRPRPPCLSSVQQPARDAAFQKNSFNSEQKWCAWGCSQSKTWGSKRLE